VLDADRIAHLVQESLFLGFLGECAHETS
jgi:hypothetical protein